MHVDPAHAGERFRRLPFLSGGPVAPLVGENGSGETTLLEAIAAQCGIQPGDGRSYTETEDERDATALSAPLDVVIDRGWREGLRVMCNAVRPSFGNLCWLDDMVIET